MRVGVRDLKDKLSSYVKRAHGGEHIVITDRGTAVAKLVPADVPEGFARLVPEGPLVPPRAPRHLNAVRPVLGRAVGRRVLQQILQDRHR